MTSFLRSCRRLAPACLLLALGGCATEQVVQTNPGSYMASGHNVQEALRAANKGCARAHKVIKTDKIDADNAVVMFTCVDPLTVAKQ
jgi:hypothetical protein